MSSAFLRLEGSRHVQTGFVKTKSLRLRQRRFRSAAVAEKIRNATGSTTFWLPCLAAVGLTVGSVGTTRAAITATQWYLVGALDPNSTVNSGATTVTDLTSNNTYSSVTGGGMNLSSFTTAVSTAFTNNLGGVFNWENPNTADNSEITNAVPSSTTGTGPGGASPNDVEGFLAGSSGFNASSGLNSVSYGSVASGTSFISYYRTGSGNNIQVGTNATTASGTGTMALGGSTTVNLVFEPAAGYGVSSFGITQLSRGSNSAYNGSMTAYFSGGGSYTSTNGYLAGVANTANFIGFNAPSGQFITQVTWTPISGSISRWDDPAFILSSLPAGTNYFWTGASSNTWSGSNWSTNASGSPSTTIAASGAEAVFAASSVSSSTINTIVDTAQNIYGITVNPSESVTIGGTQSLTIGAGGFNASSATGAQVISTTGGVVIGNLQSWTVNNTLTVSSAISGTASITFNGSGMTMLANSNSYTGLAVISSGILQLNNSLALGAAPVQVNGGTLDIDGNATVSSLSTAGGVTGGIVTSSGAGVSTLTIANSSSGAYGGYIEDGANGQVAVSVPTGANLTLVVNTVSNYSGGTTVAPGATLNIGNQVAGYANITDKTLGVGPVTAGSASGTLSTLNFQTQAGGGAATHTINNNFTILGNTALIGTEGNNVLAGAIVLNGSNNTLSVDFNNKNFIFSGPLSGNGTLDAYGFGYLSNTGYGGGGFLAIGNATTAVNNSGFTGTIIADNAGNADSLGATDSTKGLQIEALQNAVLPNGVIAFTANLPVAELGPSGTANGFVGSAISFASNVTAPQIGALSSSNGGNVALVTQGSSNTTFGTGVTLTLGLTNTSVNSYNGTLYDDPSQPGSLIKAGTNTQIFTGTNTYEGGTNVSGGTLTFAAPGAFPNFTALTIGGTALANAAAHAVGLTGATKNNLFASSLSIAGSSGAWTGKLDLANNDMVVQNGNLAQITNQLAQGFNGGGWNGSGGIVSTTAAGDTTHLTALGVIQNSADGTTTGMTLYTGFDGATAAASTDVLVKYTYYGDTNLDGKVDGTDYGRIDSAYVADKTNPTAVTGWYNGDFNYDGVINGSDYTLIDNAFNTQGAQVSAEFATATAEIAGASAVPEPTTLGMLGIGAVGLLGRRRRR